MKENIVIIGGGIAGLEAARQLLSLGYNPIIIEQNRSLGGHVAKWHRLFPDMTEARDVVDDVLSGAAAAEIHLETRIHDIYPMSKGYGVQLSNGTTILCRSVLVATGFHLFNAAKKEEYGYGVYDSVVSNADVEAWLNGKTDKYFPASPKAIGFVHCVGSRDLKAGNSQCSKVCCITAIKQAIELKEKYPAAQIYCFYMDLRLFGKKYEDFYIRAQRDYGIQFIRGRVSEVGENQQGQLQVKAEDTLSGRPLKITLDLLVLMSGMICGQHNPELAKMINLSLDEDGYFKSTDNLLSINQSEMPGVFYAGACTGTKTVPETIAEARAAALSIHSYLKDSHD